MHILHLLDLCLVILLHADCALDNRFLLEYALLLFARNMVEVVNHVEVLLLHLRIFFFANLKLLVALS